MVQTNTRASTSAIVPVGLSVTTTYWRVFGRAGVRPWPTNAGGIATVTTVAELKLCTISSSVALAGTRDTLATDATLTRRALGVILALLHGFTFARAGNVDTLRQGNTHIAVRLLVTATNGLIDRQAHLGTGTTHPFAIAVAHRFRTIRGCVGAICIVAARVRRLHAFAGMIQTHARPSSGTIIAVGLTVTATHGHVFVGAHLRSDPTMPTRLTTFAALAERRLTTIIVGGTHTLRHGHALASGTMIASGTVAVSQTQVLYFDAWAVLLELEHRHGVAFTILPPLTELGVPLGDDRERAISSNHIGPPGNVPIRGVVAGGERDRRV